MVGVVVVQKQVIFHLFSNPNMSRAVAVLSIIFVLFFWRSESEARRSVCLVFGIQGSQELADKDVHYEEVRAPTAIHRPWQSVSSMIFPPDDQF
jgi:hypothetical protein